VIEIEKPQIISDCSKDDPCYGKFTVEPLERGYGQTLGNSLRRILLSSIPGAAVTSVKIEGVRHEFSTIPGVKEDVTQIILNLKKLAISLHNEDQKHVRINAIGPNEVRAEDIIADDCLEIYNKDLLIATLEDGATLFMDINISTGRGYVTVEQRKKDEQLPIDTILVDSIYTPVRKVNYTVEDMRVGQRTDFEKLVLEVWTDGSVTPKESVSIAGKIMQEHLELFIGLTANTNTAPIFVEKEDDPKVKAGVMSIDELELSVRSYNCLKRASINAVGDLVQMTESDMMKIRNLGRKSFDEIKNKLEELNLGFRPSEE